MSRWLALLIGACCALLAVAVPAAGADGAPPAAAARACPAPDYPGSGYFTSVDVRGVACGRGRAVVLAHHRCRTRGGKAGRCGRRVLGYRCSERRVSIATELNGRVTCRNAGRRVVYTYQQNL